jgi:hypothetical protein
VKIEFSKIMANNINFDKNYESRPQLVNEVRKSIKIKYQNKILRNKIKMHVKTVT